MKRKRGNTLGLLMDRQTTARRTQGELQMYAEDKAAHFELEEMVCKLPVSVRSTFLMCFSPDGSRVASTHGDHKIYVCQVSTGILLKTLEGHPRTPWCLAFHPTCNDLLASGCLGGEVRVWDLKGGGSEVWVCPERSVITSLSFHPMENFIALSTVNRVHFWDWSRPEPFATTKTSLEREKVRLVRFSPGGDYLLTGIANAPVQGIGGERLNYGQYRRSSILSRLMTMYHRLGEMLPSSPSPRHFSSMQRRMARRGGVRRFTQEELLDMIRNRYGEREALGLRHRGAQMSSRGSRTVADLVEEGPSSSWALPSFEGPSRSQEETSSPEPSIPATSSASSEPGPGRPGENAELWETFNRLRTLCTRLESRMMRHSSEYNQQLQQASASSSSSGGDTASSTVFPPEPEAPSPRTAPHVETHSEISLSLVSLLSRLQESLQSLSEATAMSGWTGDPAAARRQIREVRVRISEILERLENVSGYRERLRSLREQIYQAAERMARRGEEEESYGAATGSQQWDLAYCLWLVEMSLQLTNQMQRILTADYRLSRLHLRGGPVTGPRTRRPRLDEDGPSQAHGLRLFESSGSESESEGEAEPSSNPPFAPPPFRVYHPQYNLSARYVPHGSPLAPMNTVTHRIQYWKTLGEEVVPQISDSRARIVVSTCKIHNDGSVDVSPCGRLLVALVPDSVGVTLSVFSLEEATMGQMLYNWGFGPNAVSVSFSPLSRYIVVGLASSRYVSPQREVVAQIFRLGERPKQGQTGSVLLEHVGNMSQPLLGASGPNQLISLNCVRWLPNPGEGLVYGTNRGTLCICRPLCSVCSDCSEALTAQRTRRDSSFQTLSAQVEETATRHALLGNRRHQQGSQ